MTTQPWRSTLFASCIAQRSAFKAPRDEILAVDVTGESCVSHYSTVDKSIGSLHCHRADGERTIGWQTAMDTAEREEDMCRPTSRS